MSSLGAATGGGRSLTVVTAVGRTAEEGLKARLGSASIHEFGLVWTGTRTWTTGGSDERRKLRKYR